jgi:hypothetical protein
MEQCTIGVLSSPYGKIWMLLFEVVHKTTVNVHLDEARTVQGYPVVSNHRAWTHLTRLSLFPLQCSWTTNNSDKTTRESYNNVNTNNKIRRINLMLQ